jgi:carbonic anhydrase
MSATDSYVNNNADYATTFTGPLPLPPSKQVAVVACMDARLDVHKALGIQEGEAHVIRNAGGVISDGEIRSLAISQRLLGTREIILIHHTDCGMLTFSDESFLDSLEAETGSRPLWNPMAFTSLEDDVRVSRDAIVANPFIPHTDHVRGFIFDVATGKLHEVSR